MLSGIFVSAFYVYFMLPKYRHFTFSNEKIGDYYTGVRRVLTKIFSNREVLAYVTATENSEYRTKSVQEFRFKLSQGIRSQIFFATFVKNIETHIKSNAMTKALKQLIHQQVYVDMKNREIHVGGQLVYYEGGEGYCFHNSETKTDADIRDIPMTQMVYDAFRKQRELNLMLGLQSNVEIGGRSGFIFNTKNGHPFSADRSEDHSDAQITMNVYNHIAEKSHVENEISKMNLPETVPAVV